MAKKKGKSYGDRLVKQLKTSMGPWWSDDGIRALSAMAQESQVEVNSRDFGDLVLQPCLTFQHEMVIRDYDEQGKDFDDLSPFIYPELMRSWEHANACVEFSEGFSSVAFNSEPEYIQTVSLLGLSDFFPGCVLLDVRKLNVLVYNIPVDAIFVYPSYNAEHEHVALMMVGVNENLGFTFAYEARYVLDGETFADAARATQRFLDNERALCLGGMGTNPADEFFSALDNEPELFAVTWRLLAALCSDSADLVRQKWGRGEHIKARAKKPESQLVIEGVHVEEAPASEQPEVQVDTCEETADQENLEAGQAEQPEETAKEELTEVELYLDEMERLRGEFDKERASVAYRIKQLEAELAELRQANAALEGRANLLYSMDIPETPFEALTLAEKAFPDRIIVLERARKSAAEFVKGDPGEVWAVLRSIAVTFYQLLFETRERGLSNAFRDQTGYELALRDAKGANRNSEQKAERLVEYEGATRDATMHIKGRGVKKGEALRVHFFVDYDKKKIVIAHCGDHLTTDKTSSF